MVEVQKNPSFVPVKCRCGRSLRAKWDQVGSEIRCWDCHQAIVVPMPNPRARVANGMADRFRATIQGTGLYRVATSAILVTLALTIPRAGLGVASVVLVLMAAAYGETIRRGDASPDDAEFSWRTLARPRTLVEALVCLLMVAGTVVPLWVHHVGFHQSPYIDPYSRAILGVTWLAMPAIVVMVYAREPGEMSGGKRVLAILRRHFWLLLMSLLIVPVGFLATEAGLGLAFYLQGSLPFFALEHMPIPGKPDMYLGIPHYESMDYRLIDQRQFVRAYFDGLRGGYSMVGAMPPALSLPTRHGLNPAIIRLVPASYAVARFFLVASIVTCLLASYSIQARWLGLLTILEKTPRLEQARAIGRET